MPRARGLNGACAPIGWQRRLPIAQPLRHPSAQQHPPHRGGERLEGEGGVVRPPDRPRLLVAPARGKELCDLPPLCSPRSMA
jgi:hypothetical protein